MCSECGVLGSHRDRIGYRCGRRGYCRQPNRPDSVPLQVWRLWFAACSLGIVTVAPLLIGLRDLMRERLPLHELIEGAAGIVTLAALSAFLIALPDGPWGSALPETLVFPFLLCIAIRCRPVFAAAAAFFVGLTVIGSTTLDIGHFDTGKPLAERIIAAQAFVLAAVILAVLLAALFAERRRSEQALKQGAERLQLALDGAALGAFSADLATGRFDCDMRVARFMGTPCAHDDQRVEALRSSRRPSPHRRCRQESTAHRPRYLEGRVPGDAPA